MLISLVLVTFLSTATYAGDLTPISPSCEVSLTDARVRALFHRVRAFTAAAPSTRLTYDRDAGLVTLYGPEERVTAVTGVSRPGEFVGLTSRARDGENFEFKIFDQRRAFLYAKAPNDREQLVDVFRLHDVAYDIDSGPDEAVPREMVDLWLGRIEPLRLARQAESAPRLVAYSDCGRTGSVLDRVNDCADVNGVARTFRQVAGGDWLLVSHHQASGDQYWLDLKTGLVWGPTLREKSLAADAEVALRTTEPLTRNLPSLTQFSEAWEHGLGVLSASGGEASSERFFAINGAGESNGLFLTYRREIAERIWYSGRESVRGVLATSIHWPHVRPSTLVRPNVVAPVVATPDEPHLPRDPGLEFKLKAVGAPITFMRALDDERVMVRTQDPNGQRLVIIDLRSGDLNVMVRAPAGLGPFHVRHPHLVLGLGLDAIPTLDGLILSPRLFGDRIDTSAVPKSVVRMNMETGVIEPIGDVPVRPQTPYFREHVPPPSAVTFDDAGEVIYVAAHSVFSARAPEFKVRRDHESFGASGFNPVDADFVTLGHERVLAVSVRPSGLLLRRTGHAERYRMIFPDVKIKTFTSVDGSPLIFALTESDRITSLTGLDLDHERIVFSERLGGVDETWVAVAANRTHVFTSRADGAVRAFVLPPEVRSPTPRLAGTDAARLPYRPFAAIEDFVVRDHDTLLTSNGLLGPGVLPRFERPSAPRAYRFLTAGTRSQFKSGVAARGSRLWTIAHGALFEIDTAAETAAVVPVGATREIFSARLRVMGDTVVSCLNGGEWQLRRGVEPRVYRLKPERAAALTAELGLVQDFDVRPDGLVVAGSRKVAIVRLPDFEIDRVIFDREADPRTLTEGRHPLRVQWVGDLLLALTHTGSLVSIDSRSSRVLDQTQLWSPKDERYLKSIAIDHEERKVSVSNGRDIVTTAPGALNWNQIAFERRERDEFRLERLAPGPAFDAIETPVTESTLAEARWWLQRGITLVSRPSPPVRKRWADRLLNRIRGNR